LKIENNIEDKQDIIDRYLLDNMDENESAAFEKQLAEDSELRKETELTRLILSAIREEGEQAAFEAMKTVPKETFYKLLTSPQPATGFSRQRMIYLTLSAAAACIILLLLYTGFTPRYSSEQLFAQYYQVQPYETVPVRGGFDLSPDEREWIRQAEIFYRQADYVNALALYNRLFAQRAEQEALPAEVVFYAAICRFETEDLSGAIEILEEIVSDGTSDYQDDACWNLALAYLKDGQRKKAAEYLEQLRYKESDYTDKAGELTNKLKEKKWF